MRRRRWYRSVAAVLAIWLVGVVAEPAALHRCPLHDGAASGDTAPASATQHDGHGAASGHQHGTGGGHHAGHGCTCLGDCCAPTLLSAPAATVAITDAPVVRRPPSQPELASAYRPAAPDHARPPSIGPPLLHVG